MTNRLRVTLITVALSLVAAGLLPSNARAQFFPANTWYAAGSSAQFNNLALATGLTLSGNSNPLCGSHHWTYSNGAELDDPRSTSILAEKGNIWIVWDDNFINQVSGKGTVCFMIAVDSVVGNRAFFANATVKLDEASGTADGNIVPLLGAGESLPAAVLDLINGLSPYTTPVKLNVAMSDIRPEDAKFATIRALETAGTRIPLDRFTGLGYGPSAIGTPVYSSQSTKQANVVDYTINGPDPVTGTGSPRSYSVVSIGAAPVMVIANQTQTGSGHLGDGNYTSIDSWVLQNYLTGTYTHIRQMAHVSGESDAPIHMFQREPISGTFNTMEYCVALRRDIYLTYNGPGTIGQETGVNPASTSGCPPGSFTPPCTTENGNPFYHVTTSGGATNATRARVIGTGEMISTVNSTADGFGYAFWSFANFQGKANLKYLAVDGVDPLYSGPAANPGGVGFLPQCSTSGGVVTSCPILSFPNIANGGYPIWSVYREIYDPTDSTVYWNAVPLYARAAASTLLSDFVPSTQLSVFRSHFHQIVITNCTTNCDQAPNNGYKSGVPETGGDVGGAVLTIQSELDYINDTGGSQQVDEIE